jgi:hypothetical protein
MAVFWGFIFCDMFPLGGLFLLCDAECKFHEIICILKRQAESLGISLQWGVPPENV